ncbi:DNA circularization N-terminal domain-containing protein [Cedecea neteri]|uniref:DNA circularization protein n=1 Tax=Cedecea neteri TaxID=158822 RepID=UPI002AA8D668|nr:DNA circularization N-terminal domain-containing protein [Cedecea neteri]WPU25004.1 DNA circularization N-terminal domain-containing protein [Cedecea neteri]
MAIATDALSALLGTDYDSAKWYESLRPASFRGIKFAVVAEESSHGRRVAIHEYPYRDTAWIEDMGRGVRKITLRCFIVQDSVVYGGGDVIQQRMALIDACEKKDAGTLIHPTLGELSVSVPENGLRLGSSLSSGRAFEFTLTCVESGLRVFSVTTNTSAGNSVKDSYFKTVSTAVLTTVARIKSELRGITQAIKTIKGIVSFWTGFIDSTLSEVTNISNTLNSTFGNQRYGRYSRGRVGGTASAQRRTDAVDTGNLPKLIAQTQAQAITDRKSVSDASLALNSASTIDEYVERISGVVNAVLESTGGVNDRLRELERMANIQNAVYQQAPADRAVADSINALILFLCSAAMAAAAVNALPGSLDEAKTLTIRVSNQLDIALLAAGDRGDDGTYQALLALSDDFLATMSAQSQGLVDLTEFQSSMPLPALAIANTLYQDASRADELIASSRIPHPAFMPLKMRVLRK